MTRRKKRAFAWVAGTLAVLLIVAGAAVMTIAQSGWFRDKVRNRIVAETEKATGGRVEIGKFDFDWKTLRASVAPFVLHGKEKVGEPAFLRIGSIDVGLKIVSILKKDVDIASLIVERPEVNILFYPDGTTNIPEPKVKRKNANLAERLLRLAVQHFELRNGVVHVRDERLPFDVRGEKLAVSFDYDGAGPRYKGHVSSRKLHLNARNLKDAAFDFDSDLTFERNRLLVSNAVFSMDKTRLQADGSLHDWTSLAGEFDFAGRVYLSELSKLVPLPVEPRGDADVKGRAVLTWPGGFKVRIDGDANARNLAYHDRHARVENIDLRTAYHLTRDGIALPNVRASALGGTFEGRAEFKDDFSRLRVEGNAQGLLLSQITRVVSRPELAWSGTASGPVYVDGTVTGGPPRNFTVQANMNIRPAPGGIPIQGNLDLLWDQQADSLRLGSSNLSTSASEIKVAGTLGQTLRASVRTTDLDDLLPGIAMAGPNAPKQLPVKLLSGAASAEAVLTGPLSNPSITGKVALGRFEWEGRKFERGSADLSISSGELVAKNIDVTHSAGRLTGSGRVELRGWKVRDSSVVTADAGLRGGDLKQLLAEAGRPLAITGAVQGEAHVKGTVQAPEVVFDFIVDRPTAYGETLDQLRARGRASESLIEVTSGVMRLGKSQLDFTGAYQRTGRDWTTGDMRFQAAGGGLMLDQIRHVRDYQADVSGQVRLKAAGVARVRNSEPDLVSLNAEFEIGGITFGSSPVGNLLLTARTRNDVLEAKFDGVMRGSKVTGSGEWRLTGDYPGAAELRFTPVTFAALHEISARGKVDRELPFEGSVEGYATIRGPLKQPAELHADVVLPKIEMGQNRSQPLRTGARVQEITLRNTAPVLLSITPKAVTIQSARFAATDTSLEAAGRVAFADKSPWDVAVRGRLNLAILQLFNADLLATGNATVDTAVRGTLTDPQVTGKLELKNASLYLRDITTGVDNANGLVTFDRNRANIDKLTAEVGGGRVSFGGFIGFSSGLLMYRVQGNADQVRIRHPDGVSVTVNALMNLTGTSENGLVSGTVTVLRAGFAPRADLSGLLAQSAKPLPAPAAPNEYLRGLSFDVRVESGPGLQFQTSLTRDLQAEAELRLRGNAARPVLIGDISVSQGEVQFFGNKYTINRGEIRFINPTKLEPVFDVDLETKARGITVNISFSGTLNKLNLTYRSDPPLQSTDIIALLAVGRDPTTSAFANAQTRSNLLQSGANTLGQAIAAPVSSRLQRFFGVSRLKIDPQLTGVENIPQARLTLEQQVSRDVTLTYITNLTRTQEQIVRIQWDINRQWSAIAVREENGVFGIDFQYRKRFK